jgi:hypothetical protein
MGLVDSAAQEPRTWRFDCIDGVSTREALSMQFAENFHQAKPEPIQFARAVRAIMRDNGDGWDKETLGGEPSYSSNVANRERVTDRQRAHDAEREVSHAQLDDYLLGRVLTRMAPEPLLAELGVDRDDVYLWAPQVPDAERLGGLRQVALAMLAADPEPPAGIFGPQAARAA